jgi:hypothetical protein
MGGDCALTILVSRSALSNIEYADFAGAILSAVENGMSATVLAKMKKLKIKLKN